MIQTANNLANDKKKEPPKPHCVDEVERMEQTIPD